MIVAVTKNNNVRVRMCEHMNGDKITKETFLDELHWIMYQGVKEGTATGAEIRYMLNVAVQLTERKESVDE